MMHDPQVLFLDEPSVGLDPQTRLLLWEIIREYNQKGRTILLTTHNMEEADTLCEQLAIIDHGDHRAGHARTVEGVDPRRISTAPAFWIITPRRCWSASARWRCHRSPAVGRKRSRRLRRPRRLADSGDRECGGG
jgi:energy-coupling factor transporter ATP-binding protein EcfA2